tara:strand:- start:2885 stop:3727 length:843 start_codon:yes stop_codon:yes gene_type:complete
MKIISSLSEFLAWRASIASSASIGFVPTMGALHGGHMALIKHSLNEADITVVSIFVNPTQFGKNEDFNSYPRTLENDCNLLRPTGVNVLFAPQYEDIYRDDVKNFTFENLFSHQLEGKSRPDFFPGVINVVSRLFNIVNPSLSFFGKKDAQQLILISKMVEVGDFPVRIIPVETVREPSGLAMSSRNIYLSKTQTISASKIYKSLLLAKDLLNGGEKDSKTIKNKIKKYLLVDSTILIDYVSIVCLDDLREVSGSVNAPVLISIAVYIGGVRLIDNVFYE